jgi:Ion transport protein.
MMLAIVINAFIIFLLYFPEIREASYTAYKTLDFLDHFYVLLFALEAFFKIRHYGIKQYFSDGWNLFDFLIVLVSLPGLIHYCGFSDVIDTSIFQLLRLFRLARLIRFLKFIPNVKMIVEGLKRAIRASVFVLVVLLFLNFLFALFACHFYGTLVPDYFGNPMISSYYIFQMFTVEGWNEIPIIIATAAEKANPDGAMFTVIGARVFFIFVVLTGGIFGMSLANAIFVDEMTMDNNQKLEKKIDKMQKQLEELKEMLRK